MVDITLVAGLDTAPLFKDIDKAASLIDKKLFANRKLRVELEDKVSGPLGVMGKNATEFDRSLEYANRRLLAFGSSTVVFYSMIRAMREMVEASKNVEKAITDIQVVLKATPEGLTAFSNALFNIARNTGSTFSQVADAAKDLAHQGLTAQETLKRLSDVMSLTRFSGQGLNESVETVTASLNGFRGEVLTSTDVINKITAVSSKFAVSSEDLSEALKRAGASASDAGVNFDEYIALVTSAQQITQRGGSVIANALKSIFTREQRGGLVEELKELNIQASQSGNVVETLKNIAAQFDRLDRPQKAKVSELLGGVYQTNQLKAVLHDLNSEYSVYNQALNTSKNATDEAAKRNEALNKTFSALLNQTSVSFEQLFSNIGQKAVTSPLGGLLKEVNELIKFIDKASEESSLFGGALQGIANLITPSIIVASQVLGKIGVASVGYAIKAADTFLIGVGIIKNQQAEQQKLNNLLAGASEETRAQISAATGYLEVQRLITAEVARQNAIREAGLAQGAGLAGLGVRTQVTLPRQYLNNFADPLGAAISREQSALMNRGVPSYAAAKSIFVGSDSRVGVGVGNLFDEPSGKISEGVNREIRSGRNPGIAGIPNFALNEGQIFDAKRYSNFLQRNPQPNNPIWNQIRSDLSRMSPEDAAQFRNLINSNLGIRGPLENIYQGAYSQADISDFDKYKTGPQKIPSGPSGGRLLTGPVARRNIDDIYAGAYSERSIEDFDKYKLGPQEIPSGAYSSWQYDPLLLEGVVNTPYPSLATKFAKQRVAPPRQLLLEKDPTRNPRLYTNGEGGYIEENNIPDESAATKKYFEQLFQEHPELRGASGPSVQARVLTARSIADRSRENINPVGSRVGQRGGARSGVGRNLSLDDKVQLLQEQSIIKDVKDKINKGELSSVSRENLGVFRSNIENTLLRQLFPGFNLDEVLEHEGAAQVLSEANERAFGKYSDINKKVSRQNKLIDINTRYAQQRLDKTGFDPTKILGIGRVNNANIKELREGGFIEEAANLEAAAQQQRGQRIQTGALIASFGLPFLGGFADNAARGKSGTTTGKIYGALGGLGNGAGVGAGIGQIFGPEGALFGGAIGGLAGAAKGALDQQNRLSSDISPELEKLTGQYNDNLKAASSYAESQARLNDLIESGNGSLKDVNELFARMSENLNSITDAGLRAGIQSKNPEGAINAFSKAAQPAITQKTLEKNIALLNENTGYGILSPDREERSGIKGDIISQAAQSLLSSGLTNERIRNINNSLKPLLFGGTESGRAASDQLYGENFAKEHVLGYKPVLNQQLGADERRKGLEAQAQALGVSNLIGGLTNNEAASLLQAIISNVNTQKIAKDAESLKTGFSTTIFEFSNRLKALSQLQGVISQTLVGVDLLQKQSGLSGRGEVLSFSDRFKIGTEQSRIAGRFGLETDINKLEAEKKTSDLNLEYQQKVRDLLTSIVPIEDRVKLQGPFNVEETLKKYTSGPNPLLKDTETDLTLTAAKQLETEFGAGKYKINTEFNANQTNAQLKKSIDELTVEIEKSKNEFGKNPYTFNSGVGPLAGVVNSGQSLVQQYQQNQSLLNNNYFLKSSGQPNIAQQKVLQRGDVLGSQILQADEQLEKFGLSEDQRAAFLNTDKATLESIRQRGQKNQLDTLINPRNIASQLRSAQGLLGKLGGNPRERNNAINEGLRVLSPLEQSLDTIGSGTSPISIGDFKAGQSLNLEQQRQESNLLLVNARKKLDDQKYHTARTFYDYVNTPQSPVQKILADQISQFSNATAPGTPTQLGSQLTSKNDQLQFNLAQQNDKGFTDFITALNGFPKELETALKNNVAGAKNAESNIAQLEAAANNPKEFLKVVTQLQAATDALKNIAPKINQTLNVSLNVQDSRVKQDLNDGLKELFDRVFVLENKVNNPSKSTINLPVHSAHLNYQTSP